MRVQFPLPLTHDDILALLPSLSPHQLSLSHSQHRSFSTHHLISAENSLRFTSTNCSPSRSHSRNRRRRTAHFSPGLEILSKRERRPTTTGRGLVRRWRSDSTISSLPSVVRSVPLLFFRLSRPCHEEDTLQRREEVNEEVRECSVEGVGHVGRAEHRTLCSEEEEEEVCAD